MTLSVIIPTYNQRNELASCIDTLRKETTDSEIIVVNGPSTDGTSGSIHDRSDVDVLIECSSRNINIARNAGIRASSGDSIAFLAPCVQIESSWEAAITASMSRGADAVSGPSKPDRREPEHDELPADQSTALPLNDDNFAVTRGAITALDGFDEYLVVNGVVDAHKRLQSLDMQIMWHPEMVVEIGERSAAETTRTARFESSHWVDENNIDWGRIYRSRAYLAVKHDGSGIKTLGRIGTQAIRDGLASTIAVARGHRPPSSWAGIGVSVAKNIGAGVRAGRSARDADHTDAKNPHGLSYAASQPMIAAVHDWRDSD